MERQKQKKSMDFSQFAKHVVDIATGNTSKKKKSAKKKKKATRK